MLSDHLSLVNREDFIEQLQSLPVQDPYGAVCSGTFWNPKIIDLWSLKRSLQSAIPFLLPCRHWPGHSTLSHYTPPRARLIHARLTDWFMLISSFPALDALVILTLLKDYRQGAISMLCGRKREQMELSSWKTNQWLNHHLY